MSYGTTPFGFARKPLPVILSEIEDKAKEVFGDGIIQTPESPLGQLNGMFASLASTLWEISEATYQSYDPDQAEGARLEQLGRIRLLERVEGEEDTDYRLAISNAGRARIDLSDIGRAAFGVSGVTYVQVFENKTSEIDADGLPPHSVAVAVLGGNATEIASAIRPYIVPGIDAWGNVSISLNIDGYCRSISFARPARVRLGLQLVVRTTPDRLGCPPPSSGAIAVAAGAALTGDFRPPNGQDITLHLLRTAVSSVYPNVEVISATASALPSGDLTPLPYPIGFYQIADIDLAQITVLVA